jgi:hypothetical protein
MASIQIQACKKIHSDASQEDPRLEAGKYSQHPEAGLQQIHSEASQEDPRLKAGKYGHHPYTGLQEDPQRGQSRGPKVGGW